MGMLLQRTSYCIIDHVYVFIDAYLLKKRSVCLQACDVWLSRTLDLWQRPPTLSSDPGRYSMTQLMQSKMAGCDCRILSLLHGYWLQFGLLRTCWINMPSKVLVIILIIWINSDNTPLHNHSVINLHFSVITLDFWEHIHYSNEFVPVVYVDRF